MKILPFKYKIAENKIFKNEREIDISEYSAIGIIGRIGSGKSTLIKLLIDYELSVVRAFDEYNFSAYLSQDLTRLFVGNTLGSIIKLYENDEHEIGKHFNKKLFLKYIKMLELKIDDKLNRRLIDFSIGEAQRIAIALTSATISKIVVFDEPTTALNSHYLDIFYSIVDEIKNRSKVFIISHNFLDILKTSDYILWIDELEIKDDFIIQEILENEKIKSYYSYSKKI
ncbi:MAG: ATP-binding cassette domain-containing protein [Candidatus Marinimicrobia bacterium]|nr:ATP-binding cassette domain-containing protein [Candidatus Neomarinimicrobiota bacterium]